ncbi:enterotoxin [Crossiella sp. CA-258035]|uniref:NAD(P)/FAD-dependent oxidoreductase n=1 Tax=Crossiella sp. CA-258035 TaxID=2981138 RepID=UPI0024BD2354|nr:enterotoxin [Crossiella sp. CA-258035]WHT23254.1 enterotoxin [Crossiella sp. CA-258035]
MNIHAVVLGGVLAGMLAASALTGFADRVTIIERDQYPDGPVDRKGIPQASHTHVLIAGGAHAIDQLLPGTIDTLIAHGAQRIGLPSRFLALASRGWLRRFDEAQFLISCSRALLDWVVRDKVLRDKKIAAREGTEAIGLLGDAQRITGARLRDRDTEADLDADFIIDATGNSSRAPRWLADLGLPAVTEEKIDPDIFYATRLYRAPEDARHDFPEINIASDPTVSPVLQAGVLLPIEDHRWIVTLVGPRSAKPPVDDEGFARFARNLRHPVIANLIARAEPLTAPRQYRIPGNRRRHYERIKPWPTGFLVLGDAACTFNPVYGHGMAIAARSALAVRNGLRCNGIDRGGPIIQRAVARQADLAWTMATTQDLRYPNTTGPRPGRFSGLRQAFLDRLSWAATGRPAVAAAQFDVYTLAASPLRLLAPRVLLGALLGPGRPPLTEPPLTSEEWRACRG